MRLITFTSPAHDPASTIVSWMTAMALAQTGRRVLYVSLSRPAEYLWIRRFEVPVYDDPIEVRRAFLRSNLVSFRGISVKWPDTVTLMKLVRAGRRSGATIIIGGYRDEEEFLDLCLASDLVVACVRSTLFDIDIARFWNKTLGHRASRWAATHDHVRFLQCDIEAFSSALTFSRPTPQSCWLGRHFGALDDPFETVRIDPDWVFSRGTRSRLPRVVFQLNREILAACEGFGRNLNHMADRSYFPHVALLRSEFMKLSKGEYGRLKVPNDVIVRGGY